MNSSVPFRTIVRDSIVELEGDESAQMHTHMTFLIINITTCSIGILFAAIILIYSRLRPKYFNKAVGRLLLSLAVSDIIYAGSRMLPYEGGDLIICKIQGTILLAGALIGSLILAALSIAVLRIVIYHTLTDISWWLVAGIFTFPSVVLTCFMFLSQHSYSDDDNDGLCSLADLTAFRSLRTIEAVSVAICVTSYAVCFIYIYREKKSLVRERKELLTYRNMTMRLCFAYTIAALLSVVPEWTITYNVHAPTTDPEGRVWRILVKCLFGGGRGLVHALCFVLVFHGEKIVTLLKSASSYFFNLTANGETRYSAESSSVMIEEKTIDTLDYDLDHQDFQRRGFTTSFRSIVDSDVESGHGISFIPLPMPLPLPLPVKLKNSHS